MVIITSLIYFSCHFSGMANALPIQGGPAQGQPQYIPPPQGQFPPGGVPPVQEIPPGGQPPPQGNEAQLICFD